MAARVTTANNQLGMAGSYYAATANPFEPLPVLRGDAEADVVVVGGGYTGLHAALNAAERGYSVILLEAGRIGWGASGRNGGQMIPGWRKSAVDLIERYGEGEARLLFDMGLEARSLTLERIERHAIQCDLRTAGHLTLAAKPSDLGWMREEADTLTRTVNYPHTRVLSVEEARAAVNAPGFHGGFVDEGGGHLHPLNYALGLADTARSAGVRIYEGSAVTQINTDQGVLVHTERGGVRARYGVVACDALLGDLVPPLAARIMPVANYLIATAPLDPDRQPIRGDFAVSDSRFVVNYFRMSADGRLIFGGGERYSPNPPADMSAFVRKHMAAIFPQLRDVRIDHAWGGLVSITMNRLPHVGRYGDLFFAHGYSGQGVLIPALAGKVLAEAMAGTAERLDVLEKIAPPEFPGGAALRSPLYVLGMLWYALRDRL
ncbi:MAG: NAD(P)/FAD-dependent oxidoreductase [Hyphomonadaceae bacterium]